MPGSRTLLLPTLLAVLALFLPAPASAQVRLLGTVIDHETEAPLSGVEVTILDSDGDAIGRRFTDSIGQFQIEFPETSRFSIQARTIGYHDTQTPELWMEGKDSLEVEVRLHPDAIVLAPLEVTAWSRSAKPSPVLEDFRRRVETGFGDYITRADIENLDPVYVTDLIGRLPGVNLISSGSGRHRNISMSRSLNTASRLCPVQVYVDGMLLNTGGEMVSLDDAVTPNSVEGIEVYRGLASMPAQFVNPYSRCGVVAVWTRRGN